MRMKKRLLIALWAISLVVTATVVAVVVYHFGWRQRVELTTAAQIRIWLNEGKTQELQQGATLSWGPFSDTDPKTKDLWIENVGGIAVTLSLDYNRGQVPGGGQPGGWSQTWNYTEGTEVGVGSTIQVTITLTFPSEIGAGTYEYDSWIVATPVS